MTYPMLLYPPRGEVVSLVINTAKKIEINKAFLPIKATYFFILAGNASFLPFFSVYITYLGLSVLQVGLIQGVEPVVQLIIGPLWGSLVDKYSRHKTVLLLSIILPVLFFFGTYFLPHVEPVPTSSPLTVKPVYTSSPWTVEPGSSTWTPIGDSKSVWTYKVESKISSVQNNSNVKLSVHHTPVMKSKISVLKSYLKDSTLFPDTTTNSSLVFGLMILFSFLAYVFFSPLFPILDSATMRLVREHDDDFGKQRVWGAISWGIFASATGLAIDYYPDSSRQKYAPAFYMFAGMSILTFFIVLRVNFSPHQHQPTVWRNVGGLFLNPYFVIFLLASLVSGLAMGIMSYLFIYLQALNGSHFLMGLTNALTSFSETPVMYFSNFMIQKLGHRMMLCLIILCYGIRLICYSFLHNPWLVLPVELLHGFTFGAFRPTATSYVSILAPEGLEATVQAITYGIFSGLGRGVGILAGGVLYHIYGGRFMFRVSAMVCGATFIAICLAYIILAARLRRTRRLLQYEQI